MHKVGTNMTYSVKYFFGDDSSHSHNYGCGYDSWCFAAALARDGSKDCREAVFIIYQERPNLKLPDAYYRGVHYDITNPSVLKKLTRLAKDGEGDSRFPMAGARRFNAVLQHAVHGRIEDYSPMEDNDYDAY